MSCRTFVTAPTPLGAGGDVCPQAATLDVRSRHLSESVTVMAVVAVIGGAQGGPEAFAAKRREVPT